ncbi:MAG: hypothetical protein IH611_08740, partial [Deltaproteobacteria bacterium]|nr:hypothetical protein [Deltaproteobacteria bacterium]
SARDARAEWGAGVEEPRWLRLRLDEAYTRLNVEDQRERWTSRGSTTRHDYSTLEPTFGLGATGSFYHPNLLRFDLEGEAGPSWQRSEQESGGTNRDTNLLQRYRAGVDILRAKPYASGLFAEREVKYQDFDFYNRVRVDSRRYGGNTGYGSGIVPFRFGTSVRRRM